VASWLLVMANGLGACATKAACISSGSAGLVDSKTITAVRLYSGLV
jgi:hypothetical protein